MNISTSSAENEVVLIEGVEGELDAYTARELDRTLDDILAQGRSRLVLYASQMSFISSAGLRSVTFAQQKAQQQGGEVRVFGLNAQVRRVFEMAGLTSTCTSAITAMRQWRVGDKETSMKEENRAQDQVVGELAAMRQRIDELETLQRTSLQLTSSLDLSAVLDTHCRERPGAGGRQRLSHLPLRRRERELCLRHRSGQVGGKGRGADATPRRPHRHRGPRRPARSHRRRRRHPLYASPGGATVEHTGHRRLSPPQGRTGAGCAACRVRRTAHVSRGRAAGAGPAGRPGGHCHRELAIVRPGATRDHRAGAGEEELRRLKELQRRHRPEHGRGHLCFGRRGTFTFVNPASAALLGYEIDELVGQHWTAVVPPDQQPIIEAADERRARGESDRYELRMTRRDGTRVPVQVSGSPRFDPDSGRLLGTMGVYTDLTERLQAEAELRRHRDHLEELVNERTAALTEANAQLERANAKLAREIAEREQAEAERERLLAAERAQARRQAALFRLSAEFAATLDEAEVCRRVVDGLHDTLGYDFVALFLVDRATGDRGWPPAWALTSLRPRAARAGTERAPAS